MRCRPDFHWLLGDIDVCQLFELMIHAWQLFLYMLFGVGELPSNPRDVEEDAAVRAAPALAHFLDNGARNVIACQQLGRTTRILVALGVAPSLFFVVRGLI